MAATKPSATKAKMKKIDTRDAALTESKEHCDKLIVLLFNEQ
jgi:hypothetical protein